MTSVGGGVRSASSYSALRAAVASLVLTVTILVAAGAHAQVSAGNAKTGKLVSKLAVTPKQLDFSRIHLSSGTVTEAKSFTIEDTGGVALSVTVGAPSGSQFFTILSGQGTAVIQPHGASTVTVEFAPLHSSKSFTASIAIDSDATASTPRIKSS